MGDKLKYEMLLNLLPRNSNKDLIDLMYLLKRQDKDNKPIIYIGKNFKKVILPYEEFLKMCQRLRQINIEEGEENAN